MAGSVRLLRMALTLRLAGAMVLGVLLASTAQVASEEISTGGFAFEMQTVVPGAPDAVFEAFTARTREWWDHHFSESPRKLFFETRPGGHFIEIFDDLGNGAVHATVLHVKRPEEIRFQGALGFLGHPLSIVHTLRFDAVEGEEGRAATRIHLKVRAAGEQGEGWAGAVEGVWSHFLNERFKPYLEGTLPPRKTRD